MSMEELSGALVPMITIDGIPLMSLTPEVLLGVVILMILTGRLIPRRNYDDLRKDYDKLLDAQEKNNEQMGRLLTYAETTSQILSALPHPFDPRPPVVLPAPVKEEGDV